MTPLRRRAEELVRSELQRAPHLYVGGLDVESDSQLTLPQTNPANGAPVGRVPEATARDVHGAAKAALRAYQDGQVHDHPSERAQLLWSFAEALENESEDLCLLESLQTGHPFAGVKAHSLSEAVRSVRYLASWAHKLEGRSHALGPGRTGMSLEGGVPVFASSYDTRSPLGTAIGKTACALAVGSSVILHPPATAPSSTMRIAHLLHELGLAPGRVNVVTGGSKTAERLAAEKLVDAMSFSGDMETARRALVGSAKSNLKPIHFELGCKTACILFEDGDARRAADAVVDHLFSCRYAQFETPTRFLIHEEQYADVAANVVARAKSAVLGDPLDPHTQLGPLCSAKHLERVLAYVELGRREGAKLVAGGRQDAEGHRGRGQFLPPTVLMDTQASMRVFREDIEGPVLCLAKFSKDEEAVELANGSDYVSGACIFSADVGRAHRLAQRLEAGNVWVNEVGNFDPELGRGGAGLSGAGSHLGHRGLQQMTRSRRLAIRMR